jgi:hypothetical protein
VRAPCDQRRRRVKAGERLPTRLVSGVEESFEGVYGDRLIASLRRDEPPGGAPSVDVVAAHELLHGAALADLAELGELTTLARELDERRLEAVELRNDARRRCSSAISSARLQAGPRLLRTGTTPSV